ncbi:liver carboxylesterase 4-like [Thalassophryne amazonica]|uniref:liver carboxylesterase 4-like n=1 Tax=Thalassophryne amazonica TaxID=390379 RepID=UPI0014709FD1|nr:liver carboxylesterase 4-like [Thalassophryne amazonica]
MELRVQHFFILVSAILFLCVFADLRGPVVHTNLGSLRGEYVTIKGKDTGVHTFLGVPFAKPPVGALRLKAPQPAGGWEGVRDASHQPPICVQPKELMEDLLNKLGGLMAEIPDASEDCLYLNIYTPANKSPDAKLPVMVWIHGGGFVMGSASIGDGSALAAYQEVVVVLIQYRLGLLGFLSTGDENIPGNFGLLDQVEALRWVQQHIHNFGGDPNLVTIFGESAGGISVSLLLLSQLSYGLFHRAIAESGTAHIQSVADMDPLPVSKAMANVLGCNVENTKKMADCMKNIKVESIIDATKDMKVNFPPVFDGHFLKKPIKELYDNHELLTVPFMTGVTNDEGGYLLCEFFAPPNWTEGMDRELFLNLVSIVYPKPQDTIRMEMILEEYVGNGEDRVKNRDGFTELIGDSIFNIPAIKTANAHRDAGAPVYLYEYQYPPKFLQENRPSFVKSDHADELFTVFGFCFTTAHVKLQQACTEEEEGFSRVMMNYWGNFARTGSPNGDGLTHWPQYGAEEKYLALDIKEQVTGQHLKKDRFLFWTQTFPGPVVHTKLGSLRGDYVSVKGTKTGVHAFLGVPFAKPPVRALRLKPPQPAVGWEGVRDASRQPSMCVQHKELYQDLLKMWDLTVEIPDISEDCLYLNIYTPGNKAPDAKLPVMVWIHGGVFVSGSASMYDGSALAAYQDVVVVVIQYRLGLLGFLSTGDENIPGNFGLLDQVEALRWVQQHIHNFGGDLNLVTIFGESAGGISVSLLLLSPLSDGLFHRAIAESGTAHITIFNIITNNVLPVTQVLVNETGCHIETTRKMADCMRNLNMDKIIDFNQSFKPRFPVTVDGHFLRKPVDELFQNHELLTVPFMTGVTNDEGGWLLIKFFAPPNWTEGMDREQVLNHLSIYFTDPADDMLKQMLTDEYLGTAEDRVKNRDGLTKLLGDMMFTFPAIKAANAHRDAGAPVYLYEYQHSPSFLKTKRPSFVKSDHFDEVFTVFGLCFTTTHVKLGQACPEEEEQFSRTMMTYWGNFARTGSPNGVDVAFWPQYGAEEHYMLIDIDKQVPAQHLKKDKFITCTETIPDHIQQQKEKVHEEL